MMTDQERKDYNRAKQMVRRGDEHFVPVVQYFENGCKADRKWLPKLSKLMQKILRDHSKKEVYSRYKKNIGFSTIGKIENGYHACVSEPTAKKHFYSLRKLFGYN